MTLSDSDLTKIQNIVQKEVKDNTDPLNQKMLDLEKGQKKLQKNQSKLMSDFGNLKSGQRKLEKNQVRLMSDVENLKSGQKKLQETQAKIIRDTKDLKVGQKNLSQDLKDSVNFLDKNDLKLQKGLNRLESHHDFPQTKI